MILSVSLVCLLLEWLITWIGCVVSMWYFSVLVEGIIVLGFWLNWSAFEISIRWQSGRLGIFLIFGTVVVLFTLYCFIFSDMLCTSGSSWIYVSSGQLFFLFRFFLNIWLYIVINFGLASETLCFSLVFDFMMGSRLDEILAAINLKFSVTLSVCILVSERFWFFVILYKILCI